MASRYQREILLEDERNRGIAAVVRAGPYLFVSGSDGNRSLSTEEIDSDLTWQPEAQCRNSYERIISRLERCGYGADCVVWLEHFVSSQDWLQLRLAIWRDYFGMRGTTGGGAEGCMSGMNMVTTTALAVTPTTEHIVIAGPPTTPLPGPWTKRTQWVAQAYRPSFNLDDIRCSRAVQAGEFIFTVGVRGHSNPVSGEIAPVETPAGFPAQIRNSYAEYRSFLGKAALGLESLVRVDSHIRNINRAAEYWTICGELCGGRVPFATAPIGMPVGGTSEMDMCAMAIAPGAGKEVMWFADRPNVAQAVRAAGLVFASGCNGLHDAKTGSLRPELQGNVHKQVRQAMHQLQAALGRFDTGIEQALRLDFVLRDIHSEEALLTELRRTHGTDLPAITVSGGTPEDRAEVELSAIAVAA